MKVELPVALSSGVTSTPTPPLLVLDPDALFAKELCNLFSSLEDVSPGSGRVIACLLTGLKINGKNKKVDYFPRTSIRKGKSLRSKDKKSAIMGKASAAA
jgi:hypothetical protein